jgi:hypothetical protein
MKKLYTLLLVVLAAFSSTAQIVNIPDANFKAKLLAASPSSTIASSQSFVGNGVNALVTSYNSIDMNGDGEIQVSEAQAIKWLKIPDNSFISNVTGIEFFTNLEYFYCRNNQITDLNISNSSSLKYLNCDVNQLSNLNVSNLTSLKYLTCTFNNLTSLNIYNLTSLTYLNCLSNDLTDISFFNSSNLLHLQCEWNNLINLDVSSLTNLTSFYCNNNTSLTSLNIKNGIKYHINSNNTIDFSYNPNLEYICVNDSDVSWIQNRATYYQYNNCNINSYCSFIPGGIVYTIQGNNKSDINDNGCDSNDLSISNLKIAITGDNSNSGFFTSNMTGDYSISLNSGNYNLSPTLENPSYFNVSPVNFTVNFPPTTSPFTQNFCINANGVKNDIEVTVLPGFVARPGFDADYKIIYKNKGNQLSNGSLSFSFDDNVMDLVNALPVNTSSTSNNLSWTYSNLNPFETREIELTFNINSPMETPAVNAGDILNYTATIVGAADEMPSDNTFTLNQTVVNSYDPNDKTCLEGATITPSMVGNYVHYVIRFENTGTFPAQNVVISDIINTTKFDLSSLVPQSSSHSFLTRINSTTGKVEFIFENINLPFDDANNDGYVAFKIKTKSTLVLGNTFSNTANIYFDYNFPIVTNTATTTIAVLSKQDFDFGSYFNVYPIPAKDVLHLDTKNEIGLKTINIYNTFGQMVMVVTNPENNATIDVANLKTGTYFIKVITNKGTANTKFIKE